MCDNMRATKRTPKPLSDEEVKLIADTILNSHSYMPTKQGDYLKLRDSTVWRLANAVGGRPKEILGMKWSDLDFDKRTIKLGIFSNKERNDTPITLTKPAMQILIDYRMELERLGFICEYIFPSTESWQPITSQNYARRFLQACKEAGLAKIEYFTTSGQPKYNIRPYTARHNFCTKVYKKTHSERAVQELARHKSPESSRVYIHLDNDDKANIADSIF